MTIIVQFSDEKETKIISWFASMPPFPEQFANLGEVEHDNPKWRDYYNEVTPCIIGMPEPE
ncbi:MULTISPECIES: hypothetical protein [Yersinia]|uniref:Uncharacterized protein n=1 Tax=Yersinia enterocolitica TaxID=630 RepID=A0ABM9S1Y7_YEREN|nr:MULTISPECIES: hypothetical protein [Yersinia]MBW5875191.1 hypothetical protein [Yersinia enterocolitica]MDA5499953.1 hypothetical protein [Yersinia aleksiciae]NIL00156.1 hypothetical protein [Yersinia aleksiciae]WQC69222.1 hypothetical protein N0K21_10875 [Yersinia aleksiciae]CND96545.1 Uncharacterised protein [Yersinia enterocolitica]